MRLRYAPTSPFVRKVMVTALELGIADRIDLIPTDVWDDDSDIRSDNPLGKVPTLFTADGEVLLDSPVICEYLDAMAGHRLLPASGPARWRVLRHQVLGDGMLDATVQRVLEDRRPEAHRARAWIGRQEDSVRATLDALEDEVEEDKAEAFDLGAIAIAVALAYLDFRWPALDWRAGHPALADWHRRIAARPSMTATAFVDPD